MRGLWLLLLLVVSALTASGCEIVGGIFKAGFWAGTIIAIVVIAGVVFLLTKLRR
jgi:hypothetical protein